MLRSDGLVRMGRSCFTVALSGVFTMGAAVIGNGQSFASFDGPLAGTQSGNLFTASTFPVAINRWGCVGLMTVDNNGLTHAFVREPNGKYLTVHPPKA